MKVISLFIISYCMVLGSCKKPQDRNEPIIACTEIFAMVTIQVEKNEDLHPLTDYYTIDVKYEDTIRGQESSPEFYTVLTDSYQNHFVNDSREFLFEGYIDEEKVVSEIFVITADDCHINKVSGKEKVVLK